MKINTIGHLVKTNPIQTQSNPISEKPKMNANVYATKDYENKTAFRLEQNKPNQTQFQRPTNPSKEREEKKGYQGIFLALSCRKGYNIIYGKSQLSLKFG